MQFVQFRGQLWQHPVFRSVPMHLRLTYVYLLTSAHGNTAGLYLLPAAYMASDMQTTEPEAMSALRELETSGHVRYDRAASIVWVRHYLDLFPAKGEKQVQGVYNAAADYRHSPLYGEWLAAVTGTGDPPPKQEGAPPASEPQKATETGQGSQETPPHPMAGGSPDTDPERAVILGELKRLHPTWNMSKARWEEFLDLGDRIGWALVREAIEDTHAAEAQLPYLLEILRRWDAAEVRDRETLAAYRRKRQARSRDRPQGKGNVFLEPQTKDPEQYDYVYEQFGEGDKRAGG